MASLLLSVWENTFGIPGFSYLKVCKSLLTKPGLLTLIWLGQWLQELAIGVLVVSHTSPRCHICSSTHCWHQPPLLCQQCHVVTLSAFCNSITQWVHSLCLKLKSPKMQDLNTKTSQRRFPTWECGDQQCLHRFWKSMCTENLCLWDIFHEHWEPRSNEWLILTEQMQGGLCHYMNSSKRLLSNVKMRRPTNIIRNCWTTYGRKRYPSGKKYKFS